MSKTDGLVIKERPIGEKDKVITVLTRNGGIVEAIARGVRNTKSRLLSGVGLFTYSDFTFYEGKNNIIIDEVCPKVSFLDISEDLEKMSLCFYFSALVIAISPDENESEDFLRLFLNSLHILKNNLRPTALVKAVFELKTAEYGGFMPEIAACRSCGKYEDDVMYLDTQKGVIYCKECHSGGEPMTKPVLMGFRFCLLSEIEKAFNFTLDNEQLLMLGNASERYITSQMSMNFKTLDFYKTLVNGK